MTAGPVALSNKDMGSNKIVNLGDGAAADEGVNKGQLDTAYTDATSRANHTGTQTASTISDFDTQVRTSSLNQMTAPTADLSINSHKLTNVTDPASAQDAATKNYVDSQIAGLVSGLVIKGSVRAAVDTDTDIASAPSTLDGLTPSSGDIFLLVGQTTASENGPRVWTGAGSPMARASNWDTDAEAALGSYWDVREGTHADTFALLTNDTAITVDTTALTFVIRGDTTGTDSYSETCPSTTAGGTWTVTHNLGTKKLIVAVARVSSPYDYVEVRVERPTTNTVAVKPDVALASGEFEIMVKKAA